MTTESPTSPEQGERAPAPGPSTPRGSRRLVPRTRRRTALVLCAVLVLLLGGAGTVLLLRRASTGGAGPVLRVAPQGAGTRDGSSWADAAALTDLPALVSRLRSGGEVWLRADAGPYALAGSLPVTGGGRQGRPVVVRGVDAAGRPAKAVLRGRRTSPYRPDGASGGDVFALRGGTSHVAFRDLAFEDVGNAFLAAGPVTDLTISDTTATNVRRFFEDAQSKSERSADVSGLTIRRVTVTGFSKRAVRLRYSSHDVLLEDVTGDSQQQDGDDFAIGVHLEAQVHDVVLRRVTMRNTRDTLTSYWNGDGFATERDVHDIAFEDTVSTGNTDAGYDLKSSRTTLTGASASDNKRNYRLWGTDLTATRCRGADPAKRGGIGSQAQVWLGEGARVRLVDCAFTDTAQQTVVFDLEPQAQLAVVGGRISSSGTVKQLQSGADATFDHVAQ